MIHAAKDIFGNTGLIAGWLIILTGSLIAIYNKIAAIWTSTATIIFVNMIGLITFPMLFIISLIALAILLTIVLKG